MTSRLEAVRHIAAMVMVVLAIWSPVGETYKKALESGSLRKIVLRPRILRNGGRQMASLIQRNMQSGRTVLQLADQIFCTFEDDDCIPLTVENVPDDEVLELFRKIENCELQLNETACGNTPDCLWDDDDDANDVNDNDNGDDNGDGNDAEDDDDCGLDITAAARDCYDLDFLTVFRSTECVDLLGESSCEILPGCIWNASDSTCSRDAEETGMALQNNTQAAEALRQQQECAELSPPCGGNCTVLDDECISPLFFDFASYSIATSPLCQLFDQIFSCGSQDSAACAPPCIVEDEDDDCEFSELSEAFVDITYGADPTLQEQMRTAAQQCPGITNAGDCDGFVP